MGMKKNLEGEINELEIAVEHANKGNNEAQKAIKRYQGQLRDSGCNYKKQIEDAEEIAALNLAKFRHAQQELEESEERSKLAAAQNIAFHRVMYRSFSDSRVANQFNQL